MCRSFTFFLADIDSALMRLLIILLFSSGFAHAQSGIAHAQMDGKKFVEELKKLPRNPVPSDCVAGVGDKLSLNLNLPGAFREWRKDLSDAFSAAAKSKGFDVKTLLEPEDYDDAKAMEAFREQYSKYLNEGRSDFALTMRGYRRGDSYTCIISVTKRNHSMTLTDGNRVTRTYPIVYQVTDIVVGKKVDVLKSASRVFDSVLVDILDQR